MLSFYHLPYNRSLRIGEGEGNARQSSAISIKEKNRKGVPLFTMVFSDLVQTEFLETLKLFTREVVPAFP